MKRLVYLLLLGLLLAVLKLAADQVDAPGTVFGSAALFTLGYCAIVLVAQFVSTLRRLLGELLGQVAPEPATAFIDDPLETEAT